LLAVGDQGLDAIARRGQAVLLVLADPVQHLGFEAFTADSRRRHLLGDLLDKADVMRPQAQTDRTAPSVEQESDGQPHVVRVDAPAARVGDRRRLVIGALDQADRGVERSQSLDVGGRPAKVRL